jgi:hypothetical protein
MTDLKSLSFEEIAALISAKLMEYNVPVVLSGGSCVQIYSRAKYVTGDLDFVSSGMPGELQKIRKAMADLGFEDKGRIFKHKDISYTVEFPPGPLSVGNDYYIKPVEKELSTGKLKLLSPADSIKDRLAGYFYGNDIQCLEQALMIWEMNPVDLTDVKKWATVERSLKQYANFEKALKKRKKIHAS